ncbi:mandelate racemase/muconate lactonizing enzyme family protein [Candidatus Gracilibacteria bacterium]|nr:mandelate racemase/muconate lactonizing enzyme family protein [Candidatus Gracilibacteria bacterium]
MEIEAVDFYYLSMPEVLDVGDGSQDALLVRVQAGEHVGWGECEASPLVSIASFVCPMSHSACKPLRDSVLGQRLDGPDDIRRIGDLVRANSLDLLQADHTLSGIDIACWDLLGRKLGAPVYRLLGDRYATPKLAYASQLFGDTPQATLEQARRVRAQGYRAAKFGWGPYGRGTVADDAAQVFAAREGLGDDGVLLIDAGTVWLDAVETAVQRLEALNACRVTWLEEPFVSGALGAYRALAARAGTVRMAAGEGCHNVHMAEQLLEYADLGYIQIDAGRIGGISVARRVAEMAQQRGVNYVNHTFTSHLALSASLQAYALSDADAICEYPVEPRQLALDISNEHLLPDAEGRIQLPDAPGLGITPNLDVLAPYLVDVEIRVQGKVLYRTPPLRGRVKGTTGSLNGTGGFHGQICSLRFK